jgi:hypothetical protein
MGREMKMIIKDNESINHLQRHKLHIPNHLLLAEVEVALLLA